MGICGYMLKSNNLKDTKKFNKPNVLFRSTHYQNSEVNSNTFDLTSLNKNISFFEHKSKTSLKLNKISEQQILYKFYIEGGYRNSHPDPFIDK
jgi:hypothetical protein